MAGALRKAWVYLGLADEEDREVRYEDEDAPRVVERHRVEDVDARDGEREPRTERREAVRDEPRRAPREEDHDTGTVIPAPVARERRGSHVALAPVEERRSAEVTPFPRRTPVSEVVKDVDVSGVHRICTIHPRTYNEAKKIGETFREGTPVIMNLSDLDDADAKRLVDFAAGLVFGLQGTIERVTNKVFLLSPANLEVTSSDGDGTRVRRGLFNQS
ncbi:cell division protein SepF [Mobilicoccus caccae]|uniref:Cell division protein SepF n=1 Tax=Mobilicoccus caccae TaxID=1859295 RepID=A0ABQ6ISK5_9MICO|nr:cell division protein SepF [Mobilicoccus caccae]GMA40036.1 cell division protein SepF 2 [Mobilicoccus caccae]